MLSLTAVALVLGSYGMEPPREAKFRGTLVAQADLAPLPSQDLDRATGTPLERPGIAASVVLLTVFGTPLLTAVTVSIVTGLVWLIGGSGGFAWTYFGIILFSGIIGAVALVPFIVGLALLPVQLANRRAYDAKVKRLPTLGHAREGAFEGAVIASF